MNGLRTRGAVCRGFGEPLAVEVLSLRAPRAGEAVVQIAVCSLCHSDIASADGAWGGALPAVYGHEAAGTVVEAGPGVALVGGQRVVVTLVRACGSCALCSRGLPALCLDPPPVDAPLSDADGRPVVQGLRTAAFAEHVLVHESQLVPITNDVSFETASLLGCGVITGVGAVLHTAAVPPSAAVAVVGVGGVGLSCVGGAVLARAEPIVAVDLVAAKLTAARAMGATHLVDTTIEEPVEAVLGATGGRGVDFAFVAAGSRAALECGLGLLGRGGTLVIVGMPPTGVILELDPTSLADDGQAILGSKLGSADPHRFVPWLLERHAEGRLVLDGLVSGRYRLEEVNDAIAAVKAGSAIRNLIVLRAAPERRVSSPG